MKEKNSLPTKYRPKTWAEVIGKKNQITCEQLRSVLRDRKVHLFLLTGASGCGKTTIARLIKEDLKCSKLDFTEINGGNDRGIETIRQVIRAQQLHPLDGDVKVILIDECHRLTRDSWEALLKEAEEPSTGTYFIFATTNPEKILDTMINRCGGPSGAYNVYAVDRDEMTEFLKAINEKEGAGVPINVINEIVTQASGSPRQALVLFEKVMKLEVDKMLDAITHPIGKEPRMKGLTLQDLKQFGELTYLIDEIVPENCLIVLAGREGAGKSLVAFTIIKALLMDLFPDPERSDHAKDIGRQIAEVRIEGTGESSHDAHTISTKPEPANPEPIDDKSLYNEPPDEDFSIRLFGKYEVVKGGPVLLIDQETPGVLLQDRVDKMWAKIKRTGEYVGEKNSFECLHFQGIKVDNETSLKQLKEKIQEFKPVLLVIDSLSTIHKGSEVSPKDMALIMEKLRELVNEGREWGMTVLVIHHHSRAGSIRGSTAIPAGCDIEYSLKKDKDGHLILKSEKTRVKNFAPIRLELDTSYGRLRIRYDGAVSDIAVSDIFEELKKILLDNGWTDYKTISDKLFSIFPSLKDGKLRYTLKKYAEEGKINEDSVPNPKGGKSILRYKLK